MAASAGNSYTESVVLLSQIVNTARDGKPRGTRVLNNSGGASVEKEKLQYARINIIIINGAVLGR